MNYSEAVISGLLLGLFLALSVGPTLFAIIRYSLDHSYKAGLAFIIGVSISDFLYVILANLATKWLEFIETHSRIVGYFGSVLFIGMGLYGFIKKYKPKRPKRSSEVRISNSVYLKLFLSGFFMNTLNPAVVLIWIFAAAKVQVEDNTYKVIFFSICLGIVLTFDVLKVILADKIKQWLTLRKIMYINKLSALFIVLFGVILFCKIFFNITF